MVFGENEAGRLDELFPKYEPAEYFYCPKASKKERTLNGEITNNHPTVKPLALMQWLVRMVTCEGQIVLDPFCGSGTTLQAAREENRLFVGIEMDPEFARVARKRAGLIDAQQDDSGGSSGSGGVAHADC